MVLTECMVHLFVDVVSLKLVVRFSFASQIMIRLIQCFLLKLKKIEVALSELFHAV